jgi:hypothetical protein
MALYYTAVACTRDARDEQSYGQKRRIGIGREGSRRDEHRHKILP